MKGVRSLDGSDEGVRALRERRAYVRPNARVVAVRGADAEGWLQDLVTAGVVGLPNGGSVRSLVLSPTGRIRAEVHVVRSGDECLLVQSLDQPEAVDAVLAPYVLSSAVEIAPARTAPVLLVPGDDGWHASLEPPTNAVQVDDAAAERWRIESGLAVFPVDLDEESLPAEAGLDVPPVTDTAKGCFLGQESIARVRNLGHPTRVVVALVSDASTAPGDAVVTSDGVVGAVTSAAGAGARAAVIARVRWDARDAELRTSSGAALRRHELDTTGPPGFQDFT